LEKIAKKNGRISPAVCAGDEYPGLTPPSEAVIAIVSIITIVDIVSAENPTGVVANLVA
jgi:hypothetical protein